MTASLFNRPLVGEHPNPKKPVKITAISGDRRLTGYYKQGSTWLICAEPFSGGEIAREGTTKLYVNTNIHGEDSASETLVPVDKRGDVDRVYQDASHDLCDAVAAAIIRPDQYFDQLKHIQEMSFTALTAPVKPGPDALGAPTTASTTGPNAAASQSGAKPDKPTSTANTTLGHNRH